MGLSIHSLGVGWDTGRGSGGVETAFTKESILLVSGCHEGGQCGDLSPGRRGPRVTPESPFSHGSMQAIHDSVFILAMLHWDGLLSMAILWSLRGRDSHGSV